MSDCDGNRINEEQNEIHHVVNDIQGNVYLKQITNFVIVRIINNI